MERHTAHHQELQPDLYTHVVTGHCPGWVGTHNGRSPHGYINQRLQIQFRAPDDERCAAPKHVEPSINFGIINSITRLHLVGFFFLLIHTAMHGSMNIKFIKEQV